jgi:hypothetical protein
MAAVRHSAIAPALSVISPPTSSYPDKAFGRNSPTGNPAGPRPVRLLGAEHLHHFRFEHLLQRHLHQRPQKLLVLNGFDVDCPDLSCPWPMVCILAKGSVIATSPAYHDHSPQMLLQNFPDTTIEPGRIRIVPTESGGGGKRFQPCRQLSVVSPSNNAVILTKRARVIERKWLRARTKRA